MTSSTSQSALVRPALPAAIGAERVISVLRATSPVHVDAVVDVLVNEGFSAIELTLTTPGAMSALQRLRDRLGDDVCLGVGTVTTVDGVSEAINAGAEYVLSPAVCAEACSFAAQQGVPYVSGAFTATEALAGWQAGASAIKLFPANILGPSAVSALKAPLPQLQFIPTGGIDLESARHWLEQGCVAVGLGSPLIGDALESGDLGSLRKRALSLRQYLGSIDD